MSRSNITPSSTSVAADVPDHPAESLGGDVDVYGVGVGVLGRALGFVVYSLVIVWCATHGHHPDDLTARHAAQLCTGTGPFEDMLTKLRGTLLAARITEVWPSSTRTPQTPRLPTGLRSDRRMGAKVNRSVLPHICANTPIRVKSRAPQQKDKPANYTGRKLLVGSAVIRPIRSVVVAIKGSQSALGCQVRNSLRGVARVGGSGAAARVEATRTTGPGARRARVS